MLFIGVCQKNGRKKRSSEITQEKVVKRQVTPAAEDVEYKSYGTTIRYECGLARKFHDEVSDTTYDERYMTCNFDKTWTEFDSLDNCIWVQCLYPPEPPAEANLLRQWDGSPVNFTHNVSYVCNQDDLYFEWDRNLPEYNVTCQPGGSWSTPSVWPICIKCRIF